MLQSPASGQIDGVWSMCLARMVSGITMQNIIIWFSLGGSSFSSGTDNRACKPNPERKPARADEHGSGIVYTGKCCRGTLQASLLSRQSVEQATCVPH